MKEILVLFEIGEQIKVTVAGVCTPVLLFEDMWSWWGAIVTIHEKGKNLRPEHAYRNRHISTIENFDMKICDLPHLFWWLKLIG